VVSRLVFYEDRKQGQVREGNSKRSLENVNAWNSGLLRNAAADWPHDIAVWLTRFDLGGPSGYAPVAGVCDPERSCSLKSYFHKIIVLMHLCYLNLLIVAVETRVSRLRLL
jgi:hypothetical protein